MAVVTGFNSDSDFWELNQQLLLEPAFKAFWKGDKSKGKKDSSSMMWWIAFCYDLDPDNKWKGQALEEKGPILGEELGLGKEVGTKRAKELDPLIEAYCKFQDSAAKRQLRMLEQMLEQKTRYMATHPYNEENFEVLDKMLKSNNDAYTLLAKVTKQLSEETAEGQGKGGSAPSISDNGEI